MSEDEIYVKITNELVEVWRPVTAKIVDLDIYEISAQKIPELEEWEFQPGSIVIVRRMPDGTLRAIQLK